MLKRNSRSNIQTAYTGVNHAPPAGSEPDSAARAAALTIGHARAPSMRKEAPRQGTSRSPSISRTPNRALSFSPSAPRPPLGSSRRNSYDPAAQDAAFLDNVNQLRDLRLTHEPRQERMVKKYIPSPSGIKVIEVPESTIRQEVSRNNLMRSMPRLASLRGPKRSVVSRSPQTPAKAHSNPPSSSSSSSRLSSLQMKHRMRPVMESHEPSAELIAIQEKIDAQKRLAQQLHEKQAELERLQQQNQQLVSAALAEKKDDVHVSGSDNVKKAGSEPLDVKFENPEEISDEQDSKTVPSETAGGKESSKSGAPGLLDSIPSQDFRHSIPLDVSHALPLAAVATPVSVADSILVDSPDLPADEQLYVDAPATPPHNNEQFEPAIADQQPPYYAATHVDHENIALQSPENVASSIPNPSATNHASETEFVPIELRDSMIDHSILDEDALDETFEASAMAKILRPQYGVSPDHNEPTPVEPFPTEHVLASDASTSLVYSRESPKAKAPVMKSAMKSAPSFSHSVHSKPKENLAHQAYLLLTTAENTRLNAKLSSSNLPDQPAQFKPLPPQLGAAPSPKRFSLSLRPQNGMVSPPATASSQGGMSARSLRPATADPDHMSRSRSGSGAALANRRERPQSYQPIPPHPALQPNYQLPSKIKAAELYAKAQMRPALSFRPPQNRKSSFSREPQEDAADNTVVLNGPPPRTLRTPKQFDENGNEIASYAEHQHRNQDRTQTQSHGQGQGQGSARPSSLRAFKSRILDSDDEEEVSAPASHKSHGIVDKLTQPATFGHHRLQLDMPQEQARNVSSATSKLAPSGEKKRFGKLRRLFGKDKK